MRLTLLNRTAVMVTAGLFLSAASRAEDVTIHTQFPSSYGAYGTVSSTDVTNLATRTSNAEMVPNGGTVAVGNANPEGGGNPQRLLGVIGEIANQYTASFNSNNGILLGGYGAGGLMANAGGVEAAGGNNLIFNTSGGRVGVGLNNPGAELHVNGRIGINRGGLAGELRVTCDTASASCYANYAP